MTAQYVPVLLGASVLRRAKPAGINYARKRPDAPVEGGLWLL